MSIMKKEEECSLCLYLYICFKENERISKRERNSGFVPGFQKHFLIPLGKTSPVETRRRKNLDIWLYMKVFRTYFDVANVAETLWRHRGVKRRCHNVVQTSRRKKTSGKLSYTTNYQGRFDVRFRRDVEWRFYDVFCRVGWCVYNFGAWNEGWIHRIVRDYIRMYPDLFAELAKVGSSLGIIHK